MADYYQVKNQNIFNPPANTSLGNATNQFDDVYVQNDLVLGNTTVTGATINTPKVSTITYPGDDTAADTAGGQTITLTGSGFLAGASVLINGSAVGVVSVVSTTTITFTSPANATGSYVLYVINTDGGTAISIPGIQYSGTPTWTTAAGSLGNVYETVNFSQSVTATGDAPITYSVYSGSLPPGATFNSNGTITGTSQLSASPTTYTFIVRATDAQLQDTNRSFSLTITPDVVTWASPANGTTYTSFANSAISNVVLSATSAVGSGITYTANALPTGLSLTGANISGTPTVAANTSSLLTATANTTSESSSITINWSVSVASDPYFMYNSLLLPGNGSNGAQNNTFLDGSTNNFTITRNGNTTQGTFSPYGPNWSNYFNGSAQLSFSTNSGYAFGTGDFTVECWYYAISNPGYRTLIETRASNGTSTGWSLAADSGGAMYVYSAGFIVTGITVVLNTWNHVAFTRSGSTQYFFLNGALVNSTTTARTYSDTNLGIGGVAYSTGEYWTGYLSNVRLIKGTCLYTTAFTPSTAPLTAVSGTTMLTCQSNRFIDNSTTNATITAGSGLTIQRFSPFSPGATYSTSTIGGSAYFDGTGDYLTLSMTGGVGSGDFTIEYWFYPTALYNYITVFATTRSATGLNVGTQAAGQIVLYSSSGGEILRGATAMKLNTWNHCAFTRSGTTMRGYLNGIQDATGTSSNNFSATSAYIGQLGDGSEIPTGYVSDLRIVSGTALYTGSTLTVPTAPLTAVSNTRLLTNYTNAGIIDNTMINNLETVGNAQISTAQTKFGSGSMYFDGNGDYCFLPRTSSFLFSSGDFTIELWTYISNTTDRKYILGPGTDTASHYKGFGLEIFGQQLSMWASSNGTSWNMLEADTPSNRGSTLMAANTWYNIAVTRSGNTFRSFVNGVVEKTFTVAGTIYSDPTIPYNIGRTAYLNGNFYYNGYMDDLRITLGYARYTSNFTPATSAFPTY